jgi:hypothetical protein
VERSVTLGPRTDAPLFVLARSVPASRYRPGRSSERLGWTIAIGVVAMLVGGVIAGPRRTMCGQSREEIARLAIYKYANEAYPEFRLANPTRDCPVALRELNEWMNAKNILDPWGVAYTMTCTPTGIVVRSAGEDSTFGTTDDLWSNG